MNCPDCGSDTLVGGVPPSLREHALADRVAVCTRCLSVTPATDDGSPAPAGADDPSDLGRVSTALPGDEVGALAIVLAVDLLDSLATNRPAIEALLETAERRGVDPVLTIERLAADPGVSPATDLRRRLDQLEGFRD